MLAVRVGSHAKFTGHNSLLARAPGTRVGGSTTEYSRIYHASPSHHTPAAVAYRLNRRPDGVPGRRHVKAAGLPDSGNNKKTKLGVVGGSNLTDSQLFAHLDKKLVETRYGDITVYDCHDDAEEQICFVRRHYTSAEESYVPPHLVNSRGIMRAFESLGVDRILLVCSVGSLQKSAIPPHSIVMPNDYIAFWNTATFAENDKIGELVPTFDLDGRASGLKALKEQGYGKKMKLVTDDVVYVQMRGPRFEAKAESRALKMLGGDVVGMTGVSEVVLANELRIPVTMLAFADNYANGIDDDIDADAYTQFYANVQAEMETVEGAVGTVMNALIKSDDSGINGYKPIGLLSR